MPVVNVINEVTNAFQKTLEGDSAALQQVVNRYALSTDELPSILREATENGQVSQVNADTLTAAFQGIFPRSW